MGLFTQLDSIHYMHSLLFLTEQEAQDASTCLLYNLDVPYVEDERPVLYYSRDRLWTYEFFTQERLDMETVAYLQWATHPITTTINATYE